VTVCIAAVCDDGKKIVVAADRMFTASAVGLEFETEEQKIESLGQSCVMMFSGNSAYGTEVLNETRTRLGGNQSPAIADVVPHAEWAYKTVRARKAESQIVAASLGQDFAAFVQRGGTLPQYLQTQATMFQQIVTLVNQFNIGLDAIVAGVDTTGARIAQITHPGLVAWMDKLGYSAIGSGAVQALTCLYLGAQTRHRNIFETLYGVYEAKRASERAPGVGKETNLAIIESGHVRACPEDTLTTLETIHKETTKKSVPVLDPLKAAM
jgi:20S proteasome alpha/beta subunit